MAGKKKKSKAQINRMLKRAEARGASYEVPSPADNGDEELQSPGDDNRGDDDDDGVKAAITKTRCQEEEPQVQGDTVLPLDSSDPPASTTAKSHESSSTVAAAKDDHVKLKRQIAVELKQSLESIANAEALKAKERRSAKRKAEAIAAEKAGCSAEELLSWLEKDQIATAAAAASSAATSASSATGTTHDTKKRKGEERDASKGNDGKKKNPYIVFIGQLSYDTTKESLLAHIQKELEKEVDESGNRFDISADTVSIRLLTDPKTKKSRGMAFVEVQDPQLLYACLKLHLTFLEGRRLNVERSAGGKSTSTTRQSKIAELRKEQQDHMQHVVETMLQEHYDNGTIQKGEIDDGVIALCKRHAATVVQASLERYCESHGRDMDNPSAYLTFLLGKLAEEGIFEKKEDHKNSNQNKEVVSGLSSSPRFKKQKNNHASSSSSTRGRGGFNKNNSNHDNRRHNGPSEKYSKRENPKSSSSSSVFAKQGVDMSISEKTAGHEQKDLSSIFPSISSRGGRKG